jgi:acetolactate synthase-1/2/3 large subunit
MEVPENLIHVDINPAVFNKNYPAKVAIEGDAGIVVRCLLDELHAAGFKARRLVETLRDQIRHDKEAYYDEWRQHVTDRVNPFLFFQSLRHQLDDDAITVLDDGNHTFLTAELLPIYKSRHLITPSDFNCMGYCVPAAIGAKLGNPEKQVIGIVGDGAFYMNGLEVITASVENLGIVYFVFYDGELSQISQGQEIPYNRKTCTILGEMKLEGVAQATGAAYIVIPDNEAIDDGIARALELSKNNQPVIVDVRVDYSKRTRYTQGVVKVNLNRFPMGEKVRFIGRAAARRVTG